MAKILVVDDEIDLQHLIRQRFRRQIRDNSMQFLFAHNGQEALDQIAAEHDVDLVLSDINMPVMDGLTLLAKLREAEEITKAVIISAYGDMQNIRTAMNRGAADFLIKPIDFADMEATIDKMLGEVRKARLAQVQEQRLKGLERELELAARIQQSSLPQPGPEILRDSRFRLHAAMRPAREVGGDLYDYFLLDKDHLAVVIGDVSGKGIAAALFMMMSRTLLRVTAQQGLEPAECLRVVNQTLAGNNAAHMFVTLFYGVIDLTTGKMEFSCAGHNPPFIASTDGNIRMMDVSQGGLVLGLFGSAAYNTESVQLAPGDMLLLYTDGVNEAFNEPLDQLGEERMEAQLATTLNAPLDELVAGMLNLVDTYADGFPQSDDITMLATRFVG